MKRKTYLMESEREALRLELKTDPQNVKTQALWAGIRPGMRVADIGCGTGKTTSILNELVQPGGSAVGVDTSEERNRLAMVSYPHPSLSFDLRDVRDDLAGLGMFDFVWVRFFLEYFKRESFEIVSNLTALLREGGILCLIDLDYNSMTYHGMPERLERTLASAMTKLRQRANFDPFVGRKLYTYLYDLGYTDIEVNVSAHHVIYGELSEIDAFNWLAKVETVARKGYVDLSEFGTLEDFLGEFRKCLEDPRRFIYSPLITCRGCRKGEE
ncbi:MAG TPA: methyltransferase domain-containing protein [Thermodesulfovibrionales bacterium]|nr:methyltransferase domain-containing protein [Thermodesulfovibrionales bacterium]